MSLMKWTLTVAALSTLAAMSVSAQNAPAGNPLAGNADAIRFGTGLYRARCADCHGMDARGVRAPDLTQVWASGRTDDGLFKTLKNGVPGTEMPAFGPAHVRSGGLADSGVSADARRVGADRSAQGQRRKRTARSSAPTARAVIAWTARADGWDRISPASASARTRDMMVKQIRGATEDFRPGYEPVTLTASRRTGRFTASRKTKTTSPCRSWTRESGFRGIRRTR